MSCGTFKMSKKCLCVFSDLGKCRKMSVAHLVVGPGPRKMSPRFGGHFLRRRKCPLGHLKCQNMSFATFKMSKIFLCVFCDLGKCQARILVVGPATRPRNILCYPAASVPCTLPSLTSVSRLLVLAFGFPEMVSQVPKLLLRWPRDEPI